MFIVDVKQKMIKKIEIKIVIKEELKKLLFMIKTSIELALSKSKELNKIMMLNKNNIAYKKGFVNIFQLIFNIIKFKSLIYLIFHYSLRLLSRTFGKGRRIRRAASVK